MPAVSKKQQRFFGYLLSNPDERKKRGISKKAAKDFAQDVQEVAPPGWGHTKAEKEKTKPWKPKSEPLPLAGAKKSERYQSVGNGIGNGFVKTTSTLSGDYVIGQAYNKGNLVVLSKEDAKDETTGKRR